MMLRREGDEKGIVGSIWAVGSTCFWPGWTAGMRHFGRRGVVVLSGDNEQQVVIKAVPMRLL